MPTVFTVTNTNDTAAGSLRQAILDANADINPDADTINFTAVAGTITAVGEMVIAGDLTINGPGAGVLSVSGGTVNRIFNINGTGRRTVNIVGLTLTAGKSAANGGAVTIADENVTFTKCDLTNNSANEGGAVSLTGLRSVDNNIFLTFDGCNLKTNNATVDGGAINLQEGGTLIVKNSTVSGNTAGSDGGMVYMNRHGGLVIENSTVSGNTATAGIGGAVYFFDRVSNAGFTVRNSTITKNQSGGNGGAFALAAANGEFRFLNSTITENTSGLGGGGINLANGTTSRLVIESTIISGNFALGGVDVNTVVATPVVVKNSAIGDTSSIVTFIDQGGNLAPGTPLLLGALQNNGGSVETLLPATGSPLINHGSNPLASATDTRGSGFPRVSGARIDIGAVEVQNDPDPTANAVVGDVSISGATNQTVTVTYVDNTLINGSSLGTGDITVAGPGGFAATPTFVSAVPGGNAATITATYTFATPGGAWDNGDNGTYTIAIGLNQVSDTGGTFIVAGDNSTFQVGIAKTFVVTTDVDSVAGSLREAIANANAFVSFGNVISFDPAFFATAKTILLTGGEMAISQPLTVTGTGSGLLALDGNATGRIFNVGGILPYTVTFSGMTLKNGVSAANGGAIIAGPQNINILNCILTNNKAASGGAIDFAGFRAVQSNLALTIEDSTISNNTATGAGGAIRLSQSTNLIIRRSTVSGNAATGNGGAAYFNTEGSFLVEGSTVSGNTATGSGGGLYLFGTINSLGGIVRNSTFSNNKSATGGAAIGFVSSGSDAAFGTLSVQNSTITQNTSTGGKGGGIGVLSTNGRTEINIESSIVSGNTNATAPDIANANKTTIGFSAIGSNTGFTLTAGAGPNVGFGSALNLGPLANNGGTLLTHFPGPGSPVRNTGSNPTGSITDNRGAGFPRTLESKTDIGSVESTDPTPTASATAADAAIGSPNLYTFTVTYADSNSSINVSTLGTGDVTVTGPNGFSATPTFVSVDVNSNGSPRVATYSFTAPGGSWDAIAEVGVYTITMVASQVFDTDAPTPVSVLPGVIGSFQFAFPYNVVTNVADSGPGSLRNVIAACNANPAIDTIIFEPTVFNVARTISLTSGELLITDSVSIPGTGVSLLTVTRDAAAVNLFRIFNINGSGVIDVTISGMTITGGKTGSNAPNGGGGTDNDGAALFLFNDNVTIDRVVMTGNVSGSEGGAIGVASINGGGAGSLIVRNSTISGNTANGDPSPSFGGGGGGIYFANGGTLLLDRSTVSGNVSTLGMGGGLYLYGSNGGLTNFTIRNSTISGNTCGTNGGGLVFYTAGPNPAHVMTIQNSTIVNNVAGSSGGGIARLDSSATFELTSTIVAKNTNAGSPDFAGDITANFSLIGDPTGANVTGANNLNGDPLLGPLANNGGTTFTHAPTALSPVIDQGNNSASFASDQRGSPFVRLFNGAPVNAGDGTDIGAFEVQPAPAPSKVTAVLVNNGAAQRSRVTTVQVTFSQIVVLSGAPAAAFQLKRQSDNALPTLSAAVNNAGPGTVVTLTFSGATAVDFGSLADGLFTLTIDATKVSSAGGQLDGDGNGTGGDNFVLIGSKAAAPKLFRLFGDADGDGDVDNTDFVAFRAAFGNGPSIFDFDGDGDTDNNDFVAFRGRFGSMLP